MKKFNAKLLETVAWSVAGVVLCGALAYYNFVDKPIEAEETIGVGVVCPDFTVEYIALEEGVFKDCDEAFTLSEHQGKVRIINFWATWCNPCIQELPEFSELKEEYPEIEVVAVASCATNNTELIQWMNDKEYRKVTPEADWTEFVFSFGWYVEADKVWENLGGKGALPTTVIVNQEGVIVHHQNGKMNLEQLRDIVEPLIKGADSSSNDE